MTMAADLVEDLEGEQSILLVDDDPIMIQLLARALVGSAQMRFATDGDEALRQLQEHGADLVLLDANMPGRSGFDVCAALRADPSLAEIPVIFVTGNRAPEFELRALEAGAVDFISKPITEALLAARVRTHLRLKRLSDQLRRLATIDALTGLTARRVLDETLEREWQRTLRDAQPISLLMIDVDHFKRYNDRYGHPAGDACLRRVAQAIRDVAHRPGDLAARFGGEEFALLLPQTPRDGAQAVAARLLQSLHDAALPHADSPTSDRLSVSIGIGCFDAHSGSWSSATGRPGDQLPERPGVADLVAGADRALYAAKAAGRGRACVLDIDPADPAAPGRRPDALHAGP